jgi:chromosome segregation ATPase
MVATIDENTPRLSVDAAQLLADLPPRVARMETHIEYMRLDIAELKAGQKELRTELRSEVAGLRTELKSELAGLRAQTETKFLWLIGTMITGFGGILAVMAQGFHVIGKGQ